MMVTLFLTSTGLAQSSAVSSSNPLVPLCAPYALYPDPLLAQVLAASTYPDQLMEASLWCSNNPGVQGEALSVAMDLQPWENSVKALCTFPSVLKTMTGDLNSTTELGKDFLADKAGVMDCIQALRAQAKTMGALKSTSQQTVTTVNGSIVIEPATPDVIYVPTYDAPALYDASYPYGAGLLAFGTGVALGAAFTHNYGAFNWGAHGMYMGSAVYRGGAYRRGAYGGAYRGTTAWGHNYGYARSGGFHTGTGGVYRGPGGNTTVYHRGTTAAGYRGYGGYGGAYRHHSGFATTAGGGYASHFASRGFRSMGAGGFHFGGGFRGGFRR